MKIKELPMEERPMERMLSSGTKALSNAELIAVIIRTGQGQESAIGLAERILAFSGNENYMGYGSLNGLMNTSPEELMTIPGVGKSKACAIAAATELAKRLNKPQPSKKIDVHCASEAAGIFMDDLRFERKEHFKSLLLDAKGRIIFIDDVSIGDLTTTPVHPREVFKSAIKKSAASVIFVHNHPSGDPEPSMDDIALTSRLVSAGKLIGIKVLDHIIIGDGEYYSFAGVGLLDN